MNQNNIHSGDVGITPIPRVNTAEEVYDQMQELLVNGTWKPGMKLPSENVLAGMFGVSRVSIRAAIAKLKALNLVETRNGSGSYVSELKGDEALLGLLQTAYLGSNADKEVFEYRNIIECGSLPLAIANQTPQDIEQLRHYLSRMHFSAEQDDVHLFASYDWKFHLKIGEMTNNPLIIRTNSILATVLQKSMITVVSQMRYKNGLAFHAQIIDAMEHKDVERAVSQMRSHIQANIDFFS